MGVEKRRKKGEGEDEGEMKRHVCGEKGRRDEGWARDKKREEREST